MKKIVIIVVGVLLVVGIAGGVFMFLQEDSAEPIVSEEGAAAAAVEQAAEPEVEAIYQSLDPAFVVSFDDGGSTRYLQVTMQVMAYDQEIVDKVEANMPAVRNALIFLFSGQDINGLNTLEGKEGLRQEALDAVNETLRLKGDAMVREVFFTSFVIQ